MRYRLLALAVLVAVCAFFPVAADAEPEKGRTLGEFRFLTSQQITDPFVVSHFRSGTGLGIASGVDLPVLIIEDVEGLPDTLLTINGNLLIAAIQFEYQHALSNRVALRAGGTSLSRVGTGLEAFIAQGLSTIMNFNAGATVRLTNSDSFLLSALVDVGYANSLFIDVTSFVKDIAGGDLENASVVKDHTGVIGGVGLSGAWATSRWTGLTGYVRASGSNAVADQKVGAIAVGAGWSMDWGQKGGTPIGIMIQGSMEHSSKDGRDGGTGGVAGVSFHYTGREDLDLAFHLGQGWVPREDPALTLNTTVLNITLRYFF